MVLNTEGFACVYWIHLPSHTDYFTEGYIGVSRNPSRRWKEHKRDANGGYHSNNYLSNAILKYTDDLIYEVIFAGTIEQCYQYEEELRPSTSIGWNLMSGGIVGSITDEGRERIRKASKKPHTLTHKWKAYNSRYKCKLTLIEYRDMMAIKKGEIPPSKANLAIFDQTEICEYANMEIAVNITGLHHTYIHDVCLSKSGRFIFMQDL